MAGAVLEWVLRDEALEVLRYRTGHFGRAPGTWAVCEALHAVAGKAMDPFA
jgi:hypothetical protein